MLVIDDGSTDGTSEMLKLEFPNVHVRTYSKSAGLIARRNELAAHCQTKYLASIDDDAYFRGSDVLTKAADFLEDNENVAVVGLPYVNVKISSTVKQAPLTDGRARVLGAFVGTAHVLRVGVFNSFGGYPEYFIRQGEESYLSLILQNSGYQIMAIDATPLHHQHSSSRRNSTILYFARRNEVITTFMLWPAHMIPLRLARLGGRMLRSVLSTGSVVSNFRGYAAGIKVSLQRASDRQPVDPKVVKEHLTLMSQPEPIADS